MQYVNGHDVAEQCISEILVINEKVKLEKCYEQDGIIAYEKFSESHYVGKCQAILPVPAEYIFNRLKFTKYEFEPGCIEHRVIEQYDSDNSITVTRVRTPILDGHLIEYCTFTSTYANNAHQLYLIGLRSIKHDQVKFSEGALVIDLLPSGFIIDVPPGLPANHCRVTLVFQVETSSLVLDGVIFSEDQIIEVVKRGYIVVFFKVKTYLEREYHQSQPDPLAIIAAHTYHSWLDVTSSLSPSFGWTCQIQKYGLSVFSKKLVSETVFAIRINWSFTKPPAVVRDAFCIQNLLGGDLIAEQATETTITKEIKIMHVGYHNKLEKDSISRYKILFYSYDIGDRHTKSFCSIANEIPAIHPSGLLVIPTAGGGSRMTALLQMCFSNGYLPWPEAEAARVVTAQTLSAYYAIRNALNNNIIDIPKPPTPRNPNFEDQFDELVQNYANLFLDSLDHFDKNSIHTIKLLSTEKRKRDKASASGALATINPREIALAPGNREQGGRPFLFLLSKSGSAPRKRYKRITETVSGTPFDTLTPEILTIVSEFLDINSILALSESCKFFNLFVNNSAKTWYYQYSNNWNAPPFTQNSGDWRVYYTHKITKEHRWKSGTVSCVDWPGHTARLNCILWDASGLVASCSHDKTVKIWDPDKNTTLSSLELPGVVSLHASTPPVTGLNILRFLAPRKNGIAEFWEWNNNAATKSREQRFGISLKGLIILENQTITWDDEIVKVWDNTTNKQIAVFSDHNARIKQVLTLPGGKYFIASSADKTISVREILGNPNTPPVVINAHSKSVNCLQILPSDCFASGGSDMYIKLWDLRNVKESFLSLKHHTGAVRCLYARGNILASGGDDKDLCLYLGRKGPYVHARTLPHPAKVQYITGYKNNILSGDSTGLLKKWTFTDSIV